MLLERYDSMAGKMSRSLDDVYGLVMSTLARKLAWRDAQHAFAWTALLAYLFMVYV